MKRILVVGDSLIDRYWYCEPTSLSPEAPIVKWKVCNIEDRPGGAANTVLNLHALAKLHESEMDIKFVSRVPAEIVNKLPRDLSRMGMIISHTKTIKNRIVLKEPHQQIVRFDQDGNDHLPECKKDSLINNIKSEKYDIGLVSDYSHGEINNDVLQAVRDSCDLVIVDPKGDDSCRYAGLVDIITPNLNELYDLTNNGLSDSANMRVISLSNSLQGARSGVVAVVLKRGDQGCTLWSRDGFEHFRPFRMDRPVVDPTGAGDTFIATITLAIAEGACLSDAVKLANKMAGMSVTYPNCWVPPYEQAFIV